MACTDILSLPTHLLVKILWHPSQSISGGPENSAYECMSPRRTFGGSNVLEKSTTPIPAPPPSADIAWNLLVASVCRDWRRLARSHVSSLSVRANLVVSRQDLANAITRFPNLTHLHLNDGSMECVDDAFLDHLASTCPKLKTLHVGTRINVFHHDASIQVPEDSHPISEAGLDRFFQQCTRIEQLSLFCIHRDVNLPRSIFQLTHMRTLVLTNSSALEDPGFANFRLLSTLHIASPHLTHQQFLSLRHLSRLIILVISRQTLLFHRDSVPDHSPSLQLPHLRSLEVNSLFHGFYELFPSGSPGTDLRRLQLGSINHIERLPTAIGELMPGLLELNLYSCWNLTGLPEEFTSLGRLENLRICSCTSFTSLSRNFGELPGLKLLELYSLPLTDLPDSFGQLTSLEILGLLDCKGVRQLPADFSCLTALETLYLGLSPVLMFPDDIGRLSNLKTLLLEENCEAQRLLPSSFTELSALTRLELNQSMIEELPQDIGKLINLQHLHLCSCPNLTEFPSSFSLLTVLEILVIDGCNRLSSFPRLDGFTRLKRLELVRCTRLAEPPASLPPTLEILAMPSCNQPVPHLVMPTLPHLRSLDLTNVDAGCSLAGITSASPLRRLKLELADDAEDLPSPWPVLPHLHTLHISGSAKLTTLPEHFRSSLPQLWRLRIENSSLRKLPAKVHKLRHLTSLEIRACKYLASLPRDIGALTRLRKLLVSDCRTVQHLPASLTRLTCLHELDASETSIRSLPSGFARLTRLRRLNLNSCAHLKTLPEDLTELKLLRYLGLEDCWDVFDSEDKVRPRSIYSMYGLQIKVYDPLSETDF